MWELPFKVAKIAVACSYYLENLDGAKLPHPFNVEHLKTFYAEFIIKVCVLHVIWATLIANTHKHEEEFDDDHN